jgi:hypothetical protein
VHYDAQGKLPMNGDATLSHNAFLGGTLNPYARYTPSGNSTAAPPIASDGKRHYGAQNVSAFVFLLPYIEQASLYSEFMDDFEQSVLQDGGTGNRYGWGPVGWYRQEILTVDAKFMACPSDGNGNKLVTGIIGANSASTSRTDNAGLSHRTGNYMCSAGDWANSTGFSSDAVAGGATAEKGWEGWTRGAFGHTYALTWEEISDGTSNVFCLSERCAGAVGGWNNEQTIAPYRSSIIQTPSVIGSASSTVNSTDPRPNGLNPSTGIFNLVAPATKIDGNNIRPLSTGEAVFRAGATRWYCANSFFTWFNTILPPNSAACTFVDSGNYRANHVALLPPTSYHTGGVNVSLCDGTVHFITDTVDVGDLSAASDFAGNAAVNSGKKCRRSAVSPFGVWGALGSRNAGEVVMLP